MTSVIEAQDLSRSFAGQKALEGLTLVVQEGEIVALVGADGAGKTTAMRLLAGVLRPDSGSARIAGIDMTSHPERARSRLGYLPQRFSLYDDLTVQENLSFLAQVRGLTGADWQGRSAEILRFVGLDAFSSRRAQHLSGGMRQKLALAACLLHRPPVLLLDEPTGGVDPLTRQAFWRLLVRLASEGTGILISTPYMDEASRCRRVGFLHRGRLLRLEPPETFRRELAGRMVEVRGKRPVPCWRPQLTSRVLPKPGSRGLPFDCGSPAVHRAAGNLWAQLGGSSGSTVRARLVEPSLEDVFRELLIEGGA